MAMTVKCFEGHSIGLVEMRTNYPDTRCNEKIYMFMMVNGFVWSLRRRFGHAYIAAENKILVTVRVQ